MKKFQHLLFLILTILMVAGCTNKEKTSTQKPNFIVILADDMGYSDLGCYGSEISTPNIDRLADEGMRMTNFYNSSRCCPTRAALLTGIYQHQAGVGHMVNVYPYPAYQGHLNERCVTIAEVLKESGYNTYMSGKWHVGETEEFWPRKRGFDRYFGLINGASSYYDVRAYRYGEPSKTMVYDDSLFFPPDTGFYATDAYSYYATMFLENQRESDKPFFLYLAYTAPHWPLHALPEDIEKYRGKYLEGWDSVRMNRFEKMRQSGILDTNWNISPRNEQVPEWESLSEEEKEDWDLRMAVYAAMIDRMDQGIGKVLAKLEEIGADENTMVIFLSDNGGSHECIKDCGRFVPRPGETGRQDSWNAYERPWANVSNTPFKMFKHWVHEGGISTPLVAWYPKVIQPNQLSNETGHIMDIMSTIVDIAGAKYPAEYKGNSIVPMQGKSLLPVFKGEKFSEPRTLFWEHQGNRAVISGKWKLVSKYPEDVWELYDIESDRTESKDLSKEKPELVEKLSKEYDNWTQQAGVVSRHELVKIKDSDH